MDEDQRQGGGFEPGDDDTSPEVTAVRSSSVGTDPGPAPEDEVVVLHEADDDATGALDVSDAEDDPEDLQLDLDDLEEEPVRPVVRLPSYEQGGDDLDAWSSFATSGPRWRDQPRRWEEEDEARTAVVAGGRRRRPEEAGRRRRRWAEGTRPAPEAAGAEGPPSAEDEARGPEGRHPSEQPAPAPEPEPEASSAIPDDDTAAGRQFFGSGPAGAPSPDDEIDITRDPAIRPAGRVVRSRPRPRPSGEGDAPAARAPRGARPDRDLGRAIAIGAGVAAVALIALAIGPALGVALVTVVVVLAAGELFATMRTAGHHPATLVGLVASASLVTAAYWRGETALPLVLALTVVVGFLWYAVTPKLVAPSLNTALTVLGVAYVGLFGSYAALLLAGPDGVGAFLGVVLAVVANDVGALVVGSKLGRHPLAPAISPRKTWEGLAGGALASVLVSVILLGLIGLAPWDTGSAFALGLLVAVVAPIGDLCESMIKRDLGVKDMGSVLPGHGGLLDRFDAMLFALPAAYYLCRVLDLM
jgi:CDP-diglyceride synthetase